MPYFVLSGPKFTALLSMIVGGIVLDHIFPILDIFIRSQDIREESLNLCKIDPNFACFW